MGILNFNSNRNRLDSIMRHYCFLSFIAAILVTTYFYNFLFKESTYIIKIDGKKVNFTGIDDFIPPFVNIVSDYFVAPKYKIMSCAIRKSMSQLAINTMCLLNDVDSFMEENHSLNETWLSKRACAHRDPEFRMIPDSLKNDTELTRFAFVRDPFDRFVSLYLDKCLKENVCWNCKDDMRCVVKNLYDSLRSIKNHKEWMPIPSYVDLHAAPLSWNCNFDKDLAKWHLLMIGADEEERRASVLQLSNILLTHGVKKDVVEKVEKETLTGETSHSTHKSKKRLLAETQVKEDPVVREYLHKIYFFDYLIFPFRRDHLDAKYQTDFWKVPEVN